MRADLQTAAFVQSPSIWARASDFIELTKPRVTFLVLFTTFVGFCCGSQLPLPFLLLFHTLAGTALMAGGAGAFNMYWERELDAKMKRTALRPVASGRLKSASAFIFAVAMSLAGFIELHFFVNSLAAALSVMILAGYLFLYTPLKRKTWLCTLVGAVPGALPIVLGWIGSRGSLSQGAWILFAIVFLWQLPHFYSIGWMYRDEYACAGIPVLSVIDRSGKRIAQQAVFCIALLIPVTMAPFLLGMAGVFYLAGAFIFGISFLLVGLLFAKTLNRRTANWLFTVSAIYLPALLTLLLFDIS
jgi:protoheme IX farnesyltransferase